MFSFSLDALSSVLDISETRFQTVVSPKNPQFSSTTRIVQDANGFVWFGTQEGLYRYDGYEYLRFSHSETDQHSLCGNYVSALWASDDGKLWVGTFSHGLCVYNPNSQQFTRFSSPLSHQHVWDITGDQSTVWVATEDGLNSVSLIDGQLSQFNPPAWGLPELVSNSLRSLLIDEEGRLLVGTKFGLNRIKFSHEREPVELENLSQFLSDDLSLNGNRITSLYQASDGVIWIGTKTDGVFLLDENNRFKHINVNRLSSKWVYGIIQPNASEIWLGTMGGGINVVDRESLEITQVYHSDSTQNDGLSINLVSDFLKDRSGLVWITTWLGGVSLHDPNNLAIKQLRYAAYGKQEKTLSNGNIMSIMEVSEDEIWLGTNGHGIDVVNHKTGDIQKLIDLEPNLMPLLNLNITALQKASQYNIWIGTLENGVFQYNIDLKRLERFSDSRGLTNQSVRSIFISNERQVYVATTTGVYHFNSGTNQFNRLEVYHNNQVADLDLGIINLVESDNGDIWVSSQQGLYVIQTGHQFLQEINNENSNQQFKSKYISGIFKSDSNTLWVSGIDDVYKVNSFENGSLNLDKVYTNKNETQPLSVNDFLEDDQSNLWSISGYYNSKNKIWHPFQKEDGASLAEQWTNARLKLKDGTMLWGGYGLLVINPNLYRPWDFTPPVTITGLLIDDKKTSQTTDKTMTLNSNNKSFSVEFASLDFSAPQDIKYQYKLLGYDKQWIETTSKRRLAHYTNLDSGNYTLEIMGTNRKGIWSENKIRLPIRVLPHWYLTLAAKIVWFVLFASFLYAIYYFRMLAVHKSKQRLELKVREKTDALELALQHSKRHRKQAEEATKAKSLFLANMSHEIRTPVHGIMGMLDLLKNTPLEIIQKDYIEKIDLSSHHLLTTINDILDYSKIEAGKLDIEETAFSLWQVIDNLQSIVGILVDKKPQLNFNIHLCKEVPIDLIGDFARINQVLLNLCSNAIKFTQKGNIDVVIDMLGKDKGRLKLNMTVTDQGIGIAEDKIGNLFKNYSQAEVSTASHFGGTGLGLVISKKFAEMMNGDITVTSELGKGSQFSFTLLLKENSDLIDHKGLPISIPENNRSLIINRNANDGKKIKSNLESLKAKNTEFISLNEVTNSISENTNNLFEKLSGFDNYIIPIDDYKEVYENLKSKGFQLDNKKVIAFSREQKQTIIQRVISNKFSGIQEFDKINILRFPLSYLQLAALIRNSLDKNTNNHLKPLENIRLLVAEDNLVNQTIIKKLLNSLGATITIVDNGKSAVDIHEKENFSLILMDIQMPLMDGIAATIDIRKNSQKPNIPIIALTANVMTGDVETYKKAGFNDHLGKPFKRDALIEKIRSLLDLK